MKQPVSFLLVTYVAIAMKMNFLASAISPNIFLSPDDYLKLQTSDMESELQALDGISSETEGARKASEILWEKQTHAMAAVIQAENNYEEEHKEVDSVEDGASPALATPHPALPMLVCDLTPLSMLMAKGTSRMEQLTSVMEKSVKLMTKSEEMLKESIGYMTYMQPLSNTDESTCFLMSVTSSLGMALFREASDEKSELQLRVQPVLPMMKIREGTVKMVKDGVKGVLNAAGPSASLQFTARFSPGVHAKFDSFNDFVTQGLHGERLLSQLLHDAFPYTSLQFKLEDIDLQKSLDWILENTKYSPAEETAFYFEVFENPLDGKVADTDSEKERLTAGVFLLLSALAARGEILSIEALPKITTFQNGGGRRNLRLAATSLL